MDYGFLMDVPSGKQVPWVMDYSGKSMDVPGNQIRHENH
jgi:hypothetical protein